MHFEQGISTKTQTNIDLRMNAIVKVTNITLYLDNNISVKSKIGENTTILFQNTLEKVRYSTELKAEWVTTNINDIIYTSRYDNIGNDCVDAPFINYYLQLMKENGTSENVTQSDFQVTYDSVAINFTNTIVMHNNAVLKTLYY